MKHVILLACALCAGCGPTPGINFSVSQDPKASRTAAVLDLEWEPHAAPPKESGIWTLSAPRAGQAVADQISSLLMDADGMKLVERTQLRKLIEENDLKNFVSKGEYRQIGKLLGADALVIGEVTVYSVAGMGPFTVASAAFSARMVDVDTGQVLWVINGSRKLDNCVEPAQCVDAILKEIKPGFLGEVKEKKRHKQ